MTAPPKQGHDPLKGLLATQGLTSFTDNVVMMMVVLLMVGAERGERAQQAAATTAFVAFNLPWLFFSVPAGAWADRWSKRSVIVMLKVFDFLLLAGSIWVLGRGRPLDGVALLALVGVKTVLLSPAKYAILPELVPAGRLAAANGRLVLSMYAGAVTGQAVGGLLLDRVPAHRGWIGVMLAALGVVGVLQALRIPAVPRGNRDAGPLKTAERGKSAIRASVSLRLALLGSFGYWSVAALLTQDIVVYATSVLGTTKTGTSLLLATLLVGIGLGGFLEARASRDRILLRHVPLGAFVMAAVLVAVVMLRPSYAGMLAMLLALGTGAGFVVVPLNAWMQDQAPPADRGAVIAVMNVVIFSGVVLGSLLTLALAAFGVTSPTILLVAAALLLLGTLYAALRGPRRLRDARTA